MGDAAGQLPDRLHLLRLAQAGLGRFPPLGFGIKLVGPSHRQQDQHHKERGRGNSEHQIARHVPQPALHDVPRRQAGSDIERESLEPARGKAPFDPVHAGNRGVLSALRTARDQLAEAGRGIELDACDGRHRVARQHRAVFPDQPKARAGAFGQWCVEPFEGGGRDRNLGSPGKCPGTVRPPFADRKNQFSRRLDAQHIADVKARIVCQLALQPGPFGCIGGGRQRKEQRGDDRVSFRVQDPDRSDIGKRADELLEALAQFGRVGAQRPLGASARDLLDAVEGHGDRAEHPQRVFGGKIQRLPDLVIGALEGGAVIGPRRIAKQQQRK